MAASGVLLSADTRDINYGLVTAVRRATVSVDRGEAVVVLGANGAGKTSLLKGIVGAVATKHRYIAVDGIDRSGWGPARLAQEGIVYVPDGGRCFPGLTVRENLTCAHHRTESDLDVVWEIFPALRDLVTQKAGSLSGGERQMLAIGRALLLRPRLLLIDEPSSGLAPILISKLYDAIRKLKDSGIALILAEQGVKAVLPVSDKVILMVTGRVVRECKAGELDHEELRQAYLGLATETASEM